MKAVIAFLSLLSISVTAFAADVGLMSFNVRVPVDAAPNDWASRAPRVARILKTYSPDVVGLQESDQGHIQSIEALTDYRLASGINTGIIYRPQSLSILEQGEFYYTETPDDPKNQTPVWGQKYFHRCVWVLFQVKTSGEKFYVLNNHLSYVSSAWKPMVQLLTQRSIEKSKSGIPVFVMGDMNIPESNEWISYMKNQGLRDTYREMKPNIQDDGTFHDWTGRTSDEKIDYIFGVGLFKTIEAKIIHDLVDGQFATDHFPIFSKVQVE